MIPRFQSLSAFHLPLFIFFSISTQWLFSLLDVDFKYELVNSNEKKSLVGTQVLKEVSTRKHVHDRYHGTLTVAS
jgi:hypothetical protein